MTIGHNIGVGGGGCFPSLFKWNYVNSVIDNMFHDGYKLPFCRCNPFNRAWTN